ncbi:MAG: universal stress protein [Actinomycetota bacterium]|nr:universal stress protein [Actinomycetota bacterium]
MTGTHKARPFVVVGVDGSRQSRAALEWAARYAGLVGAQLRAVIAWQRESGFGYFPEGERGLEHEARRVLSHAVELVLGREHDVDLVLEVVRGNPTTVLLEASRGADVLVVGDRGYGGFAGLLLGSVGENCLRHATCSVVLVREDAPTS